MPEPVPLKQSSDFDGTGIMYLGQVHETGAANRSELMTHQLGNGLVGFNAVYAHFEQLYASECAKRCEDGKSILVFLAALDGVSAWSFPANTTVKVEREDREVYIAEDVFRVVYRFRDPWLEPEFETVSLPHPVALKPNRVETNLDPRDLERYEGAFYSPQIVGDDIIFAFYAVIPQHSVNGQPWPTGNREPFKVSLVSKGGLP